MTIYVHKVRNLSRSGLVQLISAQKDTELTRGPPLLIRQDTSGRFVFKLPNATSKKQDAEYCRLYIF